MLGNCNFFNTNSQVMNKEVMLGAAAFATTLDRMKVVNFTQALDLHPYGFMYRRPRQLSRTVLVALVISGSDLEIVEF